MVRAGPLTCAAAASGPLALLPQLVTGLAHPGDLLLTGGVDRGDLLVLGVADGLHLGVAGALDAGGALLGGLAAFAGAVGHGVGGDGQAGADQEDVLGDAGALLGRTHTVGLGHLRGVQVHREQAAGERGQGGAGEPARDERGQQGRAHADLRGHEELLELLRRQVGQRGQAAGAHVAQALGLLRGDAALVQAGVQDERAGGQAQRNLDDAHGVFLPVGPAARTWSGVWRERSVSGLHLRQYQRQPAPARPEARLCAQSGRRRRLHHVAEAVDDGQWGACSPSSHP